MTEMNAIRYVPSSQDKSNKLPLSSIRIDGGTQSRAGITNSVISEYGEAMREGASFPAMVVFHDGNDYWLADGFHRFHALMMNGESEAVIDIRQGTRRDAILFSVGANASHGLRRTNDDKRRAVSTLLADAEWSCWSDRRIAECAGVSNQFVSNMRLSVNGGQIGWMRTVERNGAVYQQNTAAIGRITPAEETSSDDDLTEDDLANDPGFQSAVEALSNAKALYDEVQAMPVAEPMTPEREANLQRAFGTEDDRKNLMAIINAVRLIAPLPAAADAARSVPPTMSHAVDILAILDTANWLQSFAHAFERREDLIA